MNSNPDIEVNANNEYLVFEKILAIRQKVILTSI